MFEWFKNLFKTEVVRVEKDRRVDSEMRALFNKQEFLKAKNKIKLSLEQTRDRRSETLAIMLDQVESNKGG